MSTRFILLFMLLMSCNADDDTVAIPEPSLYFPSISDNDTWESITPEELNWSVDQIPELYNFLEDNNTKAFIVLKGGRIVIEEYWGKSITGMQDFDREKIWYWASAGKSLAATIVGIAQNQGHLNIADPTSKYLGSGWTSMEPELEDEITIFHHLTMTTGIDFNSHGFECWDPECLDFFTEPGTEWYYHNAPYTLTHQILEAAVGVDINTLSDELIEHKIGLKGQWIPAAYNNIYYSRPIDAARFGLLILNKGKWDEVDILGDPDYYNSMTTSSQNINPAYGYLWWLNGYDDYRLPAFRTSFNGSLSPSAPDDLIAALGKNGQIIDIVPSEQLVVIRMGEAANQSLVPTEFHDELWSYITKILN